MITYSEVSKAVLATASDLAVRTAGLICTEHLLYGLSCAEGCDAKELLSKCGLTSGALLAYFKPTPPTTAVRMSPRASVAVDDAQDVALRLGSSAVEPEHILYTVLEDKTSVACDIIRGMGVDPEHLQRLTYNAIVGGAGSRPSMSVSGGEDMRSGYIPSANA